MSTQAIEVQQHGQLQRVEVTQDQLTLARQTVANGLNDGEFELYLYDCKRQGVHPLDRLLIPVVTKDDNNNRRLAMWTTIDLLRSRAAESNEYAGSEDAQFEYEEGLKFPQSATVSVYRLVQGQRCMFTATARWEEYYPGDRRGFKWKQSPHIMLGKCAEALALRKAFPKQLATLYAQEELERAEEYQPEAPEPIKKTTPKTQPVQGEVVSPAAAAASPFADSEVLTDKQLKLVCTVQSTMKVSDDDFKKWLGERGIVSRKLIPKKMMNETLDFLDPKFTLHTKPDADGF